MQLTPTPKNERGFALIFAIFLTVALEGAAAGGLLQMMRQSREVHRQTESVQLSTTAEAVIDRSLRLLREYAAVKTSYPSTDAEGYVIGDDFDQIDNQPFSNWLSQWYVDSFKPQFSADPYTGVQNITIAPSDIKIREIERTSGLRRYWVEVTARSVNNTTRKTAGQQIMIQLGQLFNFSVFSNENLEITPGPSAVFQGPIFSNKSIYLFTSANSTLSLKRSASYSEAENSEDYILNSAAHIYYGFPTALGENYLLQNEEYRKAVPPEVRNPADPDLPAGKIGLALQNRDMTPYYQLLGLPQPLVLPRLYQLTNGVDATPRATQTVRVQNSSGSAYTNLTHINAAASNYHTRLVGLDWAFLLSSKYPTTTLMNYATAYDPLNPPMMLPGWTAENPLTSEPPINPKWLTLPVDTVGDKTHGVVEKKIPIGDESHPSGPHALIEPLTSLFPKDTKGTTATISDTQAVAEQKFQYLADLNIYQHSDSSLPGHENYQLGISEGWLKTRTMFDYRADLMLHLLEIDVEKLMTARPDLADAEDGLMIYVHAYKPGEGYSGATGPHGVRLINGRRIPKFGMTVATNGGIFIQGNFNDYSYEVAGCETPISDAKCFGNANDTNRAKWMAETWRVPPAFLAADRPVVQLSEQWVDPYGRAGQIAKTAFNLRNVATDHMLNAAIAAGIVPSGLVPNYPSCVTNIAGCELHPSSNVFSCNHPTNKTWMNGKDGVNALCQYYRDPVTKIYYINRKSNAFLQSVADGIPDLDPSVEIPIFFSNLSVKDFNPEIGNYGVLVPTRALFGGGFNSIKNTSVGIFHRGVAAVEPTPEHQVQDCDTVYTCPSSTVVACPVAGGYCPVGKKCMAPSGGGESTGGYTCSGCLEATVPVTTCVMKTVPATAGSPGTPARPRVTVNGVTFNTNILYSVEYSGGLENFINLQENWATKTLRYSGAMAIPWLSRWLIKSDGTPAYFNNGIYQAPIRIVDYNEDFSRGTQPPGTPSIFSLKREKIRS